MEPSRWADFTGGSVSSHGGALLLREVDRRLGLTERVARRLGEPRQRGKVRHEVVTMVRQRVHAVALGYEDLNDHDALREDPVVQTACGHDRSLASASTRCRFERRAEHQWAVAIHQELIEQFIASFARAPRELVLDFDATDDPVHGHQPGAFFHGYHDSYCFVPLYVFCGEQLLVAVDEERRVGLVKRTQEAGLARARRIGIESQNALRLSELLPAEEVRYSRQQAGAAMRTRLDKGRREIEESACPGCRGRVMAVFDTAARDVKARVLEALGAPFAGGPA